LNGERDTSVVRATYNLATVYEGLGDRAQAEAHFRKTLKLQESAIESTEIGVAHALEELAGFLHRTGRSDQAAPLLIRAANLREKSEVMERRAAENRQTLERRKGRLRNEW